MDDAQANATPTAPTSPFDTQKLLEMYRQMVLCRTLDERVRTYNEERPHSGRYYYGKTPWQTFQESKYLAREKDLSNLERDSRIRQLAAVR